MPISSPKHFFFFTSDSTVLHKMASSISQQKIMRHTKTQIKTIHSQETKQPTESGSDMIQMLEISNKEFKMNLISMVKALEER